MSDDDDSLFSKETSDGEEDYAPQQPAREPSRLFDKVVKQAREIATARRRSEEILRLQRLPEFRAADDAIQLDGAAPPATTTNKRSRPKAHLLEARPIAFEYVAEDGLNTLERRVKLAEGDEFRVERLVKARQERFLPFLCRTKFAQDPVRFYTEPTDVCCFWCTEPCNAVPVPVPVRYSEDRHSRSNFSFTVTGAFCGFACMLAAYRERFPDKGTTLARLMMKRVYGVPISLAIEAAPPRYALFKFGGALSIEHFRATGPANIRSSVTEPPFAPFSAGVSEIESVETTVFEITGREVARKRVSGLAGRNFNPTFMCAPERQSRPARGRPQQPATMPSVQEQLDASDRRLKLQMQPFNNRKKKKTLKDFMRKKP